MDAEGAARRAAREAAGEVVLTPDAGVKFAEVFPRGDGGKKSPVTGEHDISVKTIARGMSGVSGVTV